MRGMKQLYIIATVALLVNLGFGWRFQAAVSHDAGEDQAFRSLNQFTDVLQLIRRQYYDGDRVEYRTLIHGAIAGMLDTLDPFSSYIPPVQYEDMNEQTHGEFAGIGVVMSVKDNKLVIVAPIAGSPGFKAGLQPNDEIVAVDDEPTRGMKMNDAVSHIKGPPGTPVILTIFRPATKKTLDITIVREIIEISTVRNVQMVTPEIGYFMITQFSEKTPEESYTALRSLLDQGMKGLVIDLRDNPGGLLDSANSVCALFLPTGDLISYTEGRNNKRLGEDYVPDGFHVIDCPLVILQNGNSASGAEVVAGCLGDHARATLVGARTYGKGSVQNVFPLEGGGGIRLTIAHYFTPSARIIHEHGIPPDIAVPLDTELDQKLRELRTGFDVTMDAKVDPQFAKGVAVLKGKLGLGPVVPLDPPEVRDPPAGVPPTGATGAPQSLPAPLPTPDAAPAPESEPATTPTP